MNREATHCDVVKIQTQ
nr:hypothetical protein [Erwinia sp. Ejp617]